MSSPTLPLQDIINVTVLIAPQAPLQPTFNQGLIIGSSGVIPSTGANSRIRKYTSLAQMLTDGFIVSNPEYIAAGFYFSQSPAANVLWVGCQDPSGIKTAVFHVGNAGTGYVIGDTVTPTQGGASGGVLKVTSVGGGGAITGLALVTSGTGYSIAASLPSTTSGVGINALIDISAIGEPPLQAVIACRAAQSAWYMVMATVATDADNLALAGWAQTATPVAVYFYSTTDAAVLNNTAGNIAAQMLAALYNRVFGMYNTTQSGLFPNNIYAAAAAMGVACGLNNGLANSHFTMKFKQLVGVAVEPLTETNVANLAATNTNMYVNYQSAFNILQQGTVANAQFFDEIINLDMLVSNIQFNCMNVLVGSPAVPQTDPGETLLLQAVSQAAETARLLGFLAGGVWKGTTILNLSPGDTLPSGYLAQAPPYSTQTLSDRQARKAMPIYLAIIEAGAVHSLIVGVYVQR